MRRRRTQLGMVSIWFAVTSVVVIGLVGLAVDAGYSVLAMQKLQHAADAAALAAVQQLYLGPEPAQQAGIDIALANSVAGQTVQLDPNPDNLSNGDIVVGFYDRDTRTFTPTTSAPNAVKVVTRRTNTSLGGRVALAFGGAFGVPEISLQRVAIAMMANAGGADAGLIVLNETGQNVLDVQGSAILDIRSSVPNGTGAIQVNSNHADAVHAQGNALILADETYLVAYPANQPDEKFYQGGWNPNSPFVPDPLADIEPPTDWGDVQPAGSFGSNDMVTIEPGHYPDGLTIGGGAQVTMLPGIYVIGGTGLDIDGNGVVAGEGVMFYVDEGPVDIRGTGNLNLTPV
ncbi:MAG: pilus assembly protein TadG-related protein, partial [Planctomycetota bacterium]